MRIALLHRSKLTVHWRSLPSARCTIRLEKPPLSPLRDLIGELFNSRSLPSTPGLLSGTQFFCYFPFGMLIEFATRTCRNGEVFIPSAPFDRIRREYCQYSGSFGSRCPFRGKCRRRRPLQWSRCSRTSSSRSPSRASTRPSRGSYMLVW